MVEQDGRWHLSRASDFVVEICAFSFQIELILGYQPDEMPSPQIHYQVIVEGVFSLTINGETLTIDPSERPVDAAPVLALLRERVTSLVAEEDSTLLLTFPSGELRVPMDPSYEAWHLYGPDDFGLMCTPGGK